jgi:hypothetical protein
MDLPPCPLCGNPEYDREEERTDTRQCRYVLTFYDKNSIFDFD